MTERAPVLLDFESRSRADLKKVGGRRYWAHPSTEALCCAWYDTESRKRGLWHPGAAWPHHDRQLAAHNATHFDRFGGEKYGWTSRRYPSVGWLDTSELARTMGFPGALDALGTRLCGVPKDKESSRFTVSLSSVRRPSGKGNPDAITPEDWRAFTPDEKRERGVQKNIASEDLARVEKYCESDVRIMRLSWPYIESWRDLEPDVVAADHAINERGVGFDSALATRLLECDARNSERVCRAVARELGWSAAKVREYARSVPKFKHAARVPNVQAATVEAILLAPRSYSLVAVGLAKARQALASIARGKLLAGLARVSDDGRLRDNLLYYGAHPGRWSGRGMQLQNMPRPEKIYEDWTDDDICRLVDRVLAGKHWATQSEVDLLLRSCLIPAPGYEFAMCDYAGVEARMLAWIAGDERALAIFRSGSQDTYKVAAASIFGVAYDAVTKAQRTVGKIAELACQYGMGGKKFALTCLRNGADLDAVGVNPYAAVRAWRKLHAPIKQFWYAAERAFIRAIRGERVELSCFALQPSSDGRDVAVFLPSGRPIVYPEARVTRDGSIKFLGREGWTHTYGGKLTENWIQGTCRDPLAASLVRAERDGLRPCLSVHDEILSEVPRGAGKEGYEYLREVMLDLSAWADGFPAGAAGSFGRRYRKI